MSVKEEVLAKIKTLNESEIKKVADYVNFLNFQESEKPQKSNGKKDTLFDLGKNPVDVGIIDASENLDDYLY